MYFSEQDFHRSERINFSANKDKNNKIEDKERNEKNEKKDKDGSLHGKKGKKMKKSLMESISLPGTNKGDESKRPRLTVDYGQSGT